METKAKKKTVFHHVKDQTDCLWAKFQNSCEVAGYLQHGTHVIHVTDFMLYFAVDVFVCFNKKCRKRVIFIFLLFALTEKHIKNLYEI